MDTFHKAKNNRHEYHLTWPCPACNNTQRICMPSTWKSISIEDIPTPGIRSDILLKEPKHVAIEIVVTHEPEEETLARYKAAQISVFIVRIAKWSDVAELAKEVNSEHLYFGDTRKCKNCNRLRQEAEEEQQIIARTKTKIADTFAKALPNERQLNTWEFDRTGRVFPRTMNNIRPIALRLLRAGLRQSSKKPWIFFINVPGNIVFFVDFGGSEDSPFWKTQQPTIYHRTELELYYHNEDFDDLFLEFLAQHGVDYRESRE